MSADSPTLILSPDEFHKKVGMLRHDGGEMPWDALYIAQLVASHEALRDAVAVLTEERDAAIRALRYNTAREIEEREEWHADLLIRSETIVRRCEAAEARVAVLEAGLREYDAAYVEFRASDTTQPDHDPDRHAAAQWRLGKARVAARALLGGVPATKEEDVSVDDVCPACDGTGDLTREVASPVGGDPYETRVGDCPACNGTGVVGGVPAAAPERWTQEEIDTANEEGRALSAELAAASDRCLTCGSTDRAVFGPLCAIFGRFGAEPDPWHGGEIPS